MFTFFGFRRERRSVIICPVVLKHLSLSTEVAGIDKYLTAHSSRGDSPCPVTY